MHDITVHETPDPRTFGLECTCGARWVAFYGEPQVELIITGHYEETGTLDGRKIVIL